MKVRTRSRLILVTTLIVFLVVLSFITQSVILQSFGVIENQETKAHVQRFISQINNEIDNVEATCRDWASRSETGAVFSNNSGIQNTSLLFQPMSMKNLGIDYILVYDAQGHLVFSETIAKDGETIQNVPPELDIIVHNSIIPEGMPGGVTGRRGISLIGTDPVIITSYPINSGNQSEVQAGTLVMARLLDNGRIDDIDQMLQLDGTLLPFTQKSVNGILTSQDLGSAKKGEIIIKQTDENHLEGFAIITGIENTPSFLLVKIETDRPVYQQVKNSIIIVAFAIILLSIILFIAVQLLLQRFILAQLSELDTGMKSIGSSGDLSLRIPEKGDEEVVSLTHSLNQMLDQIQQQRNELHELLEEIEQQRDDLSEARHDLADRNRESRGTEPEGEYVS